MIFLPTNCWAVFRVDEEAKRMESMDGAPGSLVDADPVEWMDDPLWIFTFAVACSLNRDGTAASRGFATHMK
jgi:hypothetical protein